MTVDGMIDAVSATRSAWGRADVIQAICDRQRPIGSASGRRWAELVERFADIVLGQLVDLDPADRTTRRASDGRSLWIEPTAPRYTSEAILAQEETIITWAMDAQTDPPTPSPTVNRGGLDPFQADAAAAVAGHDGLALVVGPAGAGKTRMLTAAAENLHDQRRQVFGLALTAKAARVLERDTGMPADTIAKLLHELQRTDRPPGSEFRLAAGATLIVDEAGMLSTPTLHQLVTLAEDQRWRLALVGDPRQLQGVGRGGLLAELCANGRVERLEQLHRFTHRWEATASLRLRAGDPRALDAYEAHERIIAGSLDAHLHRIADTWLTNHDHTRSVAVVASTNDYVDTINRAVQHARLTAGHLDPDTVTPIAGGEVAHVGDVVATRRNDRRLITTTNDTVRNRETWTVAAIADDGSLAVTHREGHGTVTLPADYVRRHVRLGYAATEHGWQSDTVTTSISLASPATTRRGLYVAATRGTDENLICVITDSDDIAEARDILDGIVALDRADIPAVTQRRTLAHQQPAHQDRQSPAPSPAPRCEIPDWFQPLLDDARAELARRQHNDARRTVERQQLEQAAAITERTLRQVDAATRPDRQALASAQRAADEARWAHHAAERRLEGSSLRTRRSARNDVRGAKADMQAAAGDLDDTRLRTAASVERYSQALVERDEADRHLRRHDTAGRFHTTYGGVPAAQRRVDSLESWKVWEEGEDIPTQELRDTPDALIDRRSWNRTPERALGETIEAWVPKVGDLPGHRTLPQVRPSVGIEIGL